MIRVLLADDHKLLRQCLVELLQSQPGISIVAEAADGRTAVELTRQMTPDVVLMDICMPGLNGIEATSQIMGLGLKTRVIILSMYGDFRHVERSLSAGAYGYLTKDCDLEELTRAIHAAMCNRRYFSPAIFNEVVDDYINIKHHCDDTSLCGLTKREKEVLQFIAEGKTTKEIANELRLSVKTIEIYRTKIMNKVQVYSVAGLTQLAIREGMISLDTLS